MEDLWLPLDDLLAELWSLGTPPQESISVLFEFSKDFDSDGSGVLWSILHGAESLPYDHESH